MLQRIKINHSIWVIYHLMIFILFPRAKCTKWCDRWKWNAHIRHPVYYFTKYNQSYHSSSNITGFESTVALYWTLNKEI